jgi:Delta7-sterol 5-desaturase
MSEFILQYLPVDGAFAKTLAVFIALSLRYFLIGGLFFLIYYVWRPDYKLLFRKIQSRMAKRSEFRREILYSILTFCIFAGMVALIRFTPLYEHSKLYFDIAERGWGYFVVCVIGMIFLHDTYFYWTHRAMHHPKIYPLFHKVHHLSVNPSPWASFAFHPLEAVVEFGIVFFFFFLFPVHPAALLIFSTFMMLENTMGHLGYEFFPKSWNKTWLTKWINTSTNHNMHHQYFKGNYGLYFTIWDRLMGTLHPKYEERFEAVAGMQLNPQHSQEDSFVKQ